MLMNQFMDKLLSGTYTLIRGDKLLHSNLWIVVQVAESMKSHFVLIKVPILSK